MEKRTEITTYMAIVITTECNCKCWYCKPGGESISDKIETLTFDNLKKVIKVAYNRGVKNFRITGGEPTLVDYFGELIEYIMSFSDTKIRINTNGYRILEFIEILEKYKKRIDIIFSVDSLSEYLNGVHFPKFLSERVIQITRKLKEKEIPVRYNVVVTSLNECEVEELVIEVIKALNVNVKLLDLNKFSNYLGHGKRLEGKEATDLWNEMFVPMRYFSDFLQKISDSCEQEHTTGFIGKGHGIPMSCYFRDGNFIQVKDSWKV